MLRHDERIAIVGMAGLLPGAQDLAGFWDNIRSATDCSSDPPPDRWPIAPEKLLDLRLATPDRVPTLRGYYLPPFTADLTDMDLSAWPIDELDLVFHLALHVGNAAWLSSVTDHVDRKRCGVILGNIALPTEKANAITLEVLGPKLGLFYPSTRTNRLNRHSIGLPAALIARGLGFGLGSYALDAACASSLYAIKLACDELLAGRADAMIAGGIHRSDSMYTQMGFAQLRALSPTGRCSPFDASADGLVVGEGGCAFVLKRLSDALAHGDTIHGVVAGIGLSNDIEGNVLQPASEGQLRALRAAYQQAGWRPSDVQLIECHATGTPTGDAVEFDSLRQLWKSESGKAVLGGVKSTVGHLLTGAGAAALAKVLLAIRHKTLPPTTNFSLPSPKLDYERGPFRLLTQAKPWEASGPRRAAINGFGFGGINAHLLVEEWTGEPGALASGGWIAPMADAPGSPIAIVGIASQSGSPIESITLPLARFRIPPKELEEMLPQQTLMLKVAAEALDDTRSKPANGLRTGVYIAITLDPNTTNYSLRWLAGEIDESLKDEVHPALTANRVMGSLGSIAASRVARFLGAGGPSFAVCDESAGGLRSVALAVVALRKGEIDRAIVGAVELASDERCEQLGDASAALVLKRLDDAKRDGDRTYLVVDSVEPLGDAELAQWGAAWTLCDIAHVCRNGTPGNGTMFHLHDKADGPWGCHVLTGNVAGYGLDVSMSNEPNSKLVESQILRERVDGLFLLSADSATALVNEVEQLQSASGSSALQIARHEWQSRRDRRTGPLALAIVAANLPDLRRQLSIAIHHLRVKPNELIADSIYYSPNPLRGDVAFVYPGSGNHFPGMGRELGAAFPSILVRQMAENKLLASQYYFPSIWRDDTLDATSPRDLLFAQVALGTLISDLLISFGVKPQSVVPYSLGESAGLFGTRAWRDRDEMFRRMQESPLFTTDLAGPCEAARQKWGFASDQPIDWLTGVVSASAERVRAAIAPGDRVYIQVINTADDCVIGGERTAVENVIRKLSVPFVEVSGVTISHCDIVEVVREAYRALHVLPTEAPARIRYYSGAWGRAFDLNSESAADAITEAALGTIDFPRVVNAAYEDGARIFIEIGPGASCTRMIDSILAGRPHSALAACASRQDSVPAFLRLLAQLHAEGVPVDLSALYGEPELVKVKSSGPTITLPVGYYPRLVARPRDNLAPDIVVNDLSQSNGDAIPALLLRAPERASPVLVLTETQSETMQAHEAYLRFATAVQGHFAQTIAWQTELMQGHVGQASSLSKNGQAGSLARGLDVPRSLNFAQCMEFARGLVGKVLGSKFAEVDSFPTRVRLPDGPLQLVDRIVAIEGEPLSMTQGRVVTEHLVHEKRWYLEHGRIPGCVAIEAGQADLFLSGFLGIDFRTRGLACYRLLDAAVTFHRELPKVGELIQYDIRIDHFFRQGDTHLFRFRFDGSVNGEPLLSMRDGCAGFFTAEELAAGKGIVHTALDLTPIAGVKPDDWAPYVPLWVESLSDLQVDALRKGNLVAAFGPEFARAKLTIPSKLPDGMLKLVHRVERIEPTGGRYGLGRIRCEADIHPDDWFLTCHFVDDQVMPGTLMYECCLHTLRVLLMRMGWVCEEEEAHFEPVPGVASKLKCRGQVIASTRKVTYEVSLKEIGFRPEPFVIADALMYADGKPIVEVTNISLRMSGVTRERLDEIWKPRGPAFDRDHVLEFAVGSPSKAFGDRYKPFDGDRFIARVPGPPFSFLDRVLRADKCEQWKLAPGAAVEAEYDVPPDAWYFAANRCDSMPYSVLNEIALQACGWTAAYLGAALTSPNDLAFRNLGGNATQFAAVRPNSGTLTTRVKLTKVAPAAGMIIVAFDFDVRSGSERVYAGDTTFGFFTRSALANQVGITSAKLLDPGPIESADWSGPVPTDAPFPDDMLRMVDSIAWSSSNGGAKGLGAIEGRAIVNPEAWFFKAHFLNDPVWPGSLGLESLIQLMKIFAHRRWGDSANGWQAMVANQPHRWAYRGQIVPMANEVVVQSYVTQVDDSRRFLQADGLLAVDGRIIYQMTDFTLQG